MSDYEPTREQEKAIREYLHESIVPLIEQVLVKKLGQAMAYAAEQLVQPKREWVGLTLKDLPDEHYGNVDFGRGANWAEAKLRDKNT